MAALVTGQHAIGHSSVAVASLSVSLPGAATPGNAVLVSVDTFNYAPSAIDVTDNQGNGTYTLDAIVAGQNNSNATLFSKSGIAAAGTFTVTWTASSGTHSANVYIGEFSGVTGAAYAAALTAPAPAQNRWNGPVSGRVAAGDLVIAGCDSVGAIASENLLQTVTGWATIDTDQDGTQFVVSTWAWQAASFTGTYQAAYSESGGGEDNPVSCFIVAYRASVASSAIMADYSQFPKQPLVTV